MSHYGMKKNPAEVEAGRFLAAAGELEWDKNYKAYSVYKFVYLPIDANWHLAEAVARPRTMTRMSHHGVAGAAGRVEAHPILVHLLSESNLLSFI